MILQNKTITFATYILTYRDKSLNSYVKLYLYKCIDNTIEIYSF